MKLPNGQNAVVDINKLLLYCLNPSHFRGRHKARVFAAALGIDRNAAIRLQELLLAAAETEDATLLEKDVYGQRYMVQFDVVGWFPHGG